MQRQQVHLLVDTLLDAVQKHSIPVEAKGHFKAARREMLLGVRALIDEAIAHSARQAAAPARSTRIPIAEE